MSKRKTQNTTADPVKIYKVKKAGGSLYWWTYRGQITRSSINPPQGEETIQELTPAEFDKLIQAGEVFFK